MRNMSALLSSKNMCWCTPQDFYNKLNDEFNFVLDAAASDKTAKCELYYTPETDGLSQSWNCGGAVFCNPPYGREIGKWEKKRMRNPNGETQLFCLFRQEPTQVIFTATYMGKQKYASFAGGFDLLTITVTLLIQRHFRQ